MLGLSDSAEGYVVTPRLSLADHDVVLTKLDGDGGWVLQPRPLGDGLRGLLMTVIYMCHSQRSGKGIFQ